MARKQDTRAKVAKPVAKVAKAVDAKAPKAKAAAKSAKDVKAKVTKAATKAVTKAAAALPKSRKPAPPAVRKAVSAETSAPKASKKALKSARAQAKSIIPDVPPIPESVRTIGNQISGWLNTTIGRAMVAQLLIYVAGQLTSAAAKTETAKDAKGAVLNAGAKLGAAAADAGARMVESGKSAADTGARLLDQGKKGASDAGSLARETASAAVGVIGSIVAEVASKAIARRSGKKDAAPGKKAKKAKPDVAELAPPILADAGHKPPQLN